MARKKSRRRNESTTSHSTSQMERRPAMTADHDDAASAAPHSAAAVTTAEPLGKPSSALLKEKKMAREPQNDFMRVMVQVSKVLGSLQLAVTLLSLFTVIVFGGMLVEHFYSTPIAQNLVYQAWWFNFLLFMLGVNIFFAAAKKWPWKKHQTGFIITHIGLITMVFGGLLNYYWGVDAYVQLADTDDPQIQHAWGIQQSSTQYHYSHLNQLRVGMTSRDGGSKTFYGDFSPGALPWEFDNDYRVDMLIGVLNFLQQPLGRSWTLPLEDNGRLEVLNYIPLAQREAFVRAEKDGDPALKIQFTSPQLPKMEGWISTRGKHREFQYKEMHLPILVEIIGHNMPRELVEREFLKPPSPKELGKKGVLAVHHRGEMVHLKVDKYLGQDEIVPVGKAGLGVKLTQYIPNPLEGKSDVPAQPVLKFDLYQQGKKISNYAIFGRRLGELFDMDGQKALRQGEPGMPHFWYHAPDAKFGREGVSGAMQFALTRDGDVFYRTFTRQEDGFTVERAGIADHQRKDEYPIWGKMGWNFRVLEYFPHADPKETYVPVNIAPGKESAMDKQMYPNVVYCRLVVRDVDSGKEVNREFYLEERMRRTISLGGAQYAVSYAEKKHDLGFEIMLDRAQTTVDPGTMAPASYSSHVRIFDKKRGLDGERFYITMNEPLDYNGYTFYQSDLRSLSEVAKQPIVDARGQAVNISGFTVAYDPGIVFKYLGSIMLGLGIFFMFYMKAYFFKPLRRRRKDEPPAAEAAS